MIQMQLTISIRGDDQNALTLDILEREDANDQERELARHMEDLFRGVFAQLRDALPGEVTITEIVPTTTTTTVQPQDLAAQQETSQENITFVCALCGQERERAEIQAQFGDPPEYLCAPCYESVSAARWQEAYDRLEQKHQCQEPRAKAPGLVVTPRLAFAGRQRKS